ncbi:MAG: cytochrome c oxidase accessory protein CcoG [Verrucomicrobia bacterium]|nr:cytochrome c oxidase accessory protein CcoG [Verrucomicrobiota bacterium]
MSPTSTSSVASPAREPGPAAPAQPSNPRGDRGDEIRPEGGSAIQAADWTDFRDHLATADAAGRRRWVYPRQPQGRYYRARQWLSYGLLVLLFAGPFLRIEGNPVFLMDVVQRRFVILGQVFWPQDGAILAFGLLLFLTAIAVFTAAFGRLWCGWTCPQTVLMELVFRRIEYWIEGRRARQRALAAQPWTPAKLIKKGVKQALFLGLSFAIGNTLLAYLIGSEALLGIVTDDPRLHLQGLAFMGLFTLLFYAIFARFREQACTFICPYGRFQATLIDENSIVVAYDHRRGERRAHLQRQVPAARRRELGQGDCIDCHQCVAVCPTGIDIRNGTQMECVHCTACLDACDAIMDRIGRPRGLIRYASLDGVERGEPLRLTARILAYSALLLLLGGGLAALLLTRSNLDATLLRAPGALFHLTAEGRVNNLYQLKLVNKSAHELPVTLKLENLDGQLLLAGGNIRVPAQQLLQTSVLAELRRDQVPGGTVDLVVGVYTEGKRVSRLKTVFIGPRDTPPPSS